MSAYDVGDLCREQRAEQTSVWLMIGLKPSGLPSALPRGWADGQMPGVRIPASACPTSAVCARSRYKWDTLPAEQRPERGLLALRSGLSAFANLRPATVLPQLAESSTLKPEVPAD